MPQDVVALALRSYCAGSVDEAERLCRESLDGSDVVSGTVLRTLLGGIALDRGDVSAALSCLSAVVQRTQFSSDAYHNYGVALMRAGRREEAEACFHQAIVLAPASPWRLHRPLWRDLGDGTLLFDLGFTVDLLVMESAVLRLPTAPIP